jgi:hypothetical protein
VNELLNRIVGFRKRNMGFEIRRRFLFSEDRATTAKPRHTCPVCGSRDAWASATLIRSIVTTSATGLSITTQVDAVIRREYGFAGALLCLDTRKALEFYVDRRWGLDQKGARLERARTEGCPE